MDGSIAAHKRIVAGGKPDFKYRAVRGVAAHQQPRAAPFYMLPVLEARRDPIDAQINFVVGIGAGFGQSLVETKFLQLPCAAERTVQPGQRRTGNGPSPRSAGRRPV
jgi:hypothetical protein